MLIKMTRFNETVVYNLRNSSLKDKLAEFTDEQILSAHHEWSMSDDYPDESKLVEWIFDE